MHVLALAAGGSSNEYNKEFIIFKGEKLTSLHFLSHFSVMSEKSQNTGKLIKIPVSSKVSSVHLYFISLHYLMHFLNNKNFKLIPTEYLRSLVVYLIRETTFSNITFCINEIICKDVYTPEIHISCTIQ